MFYLYDLILIRQACLGNYLQVKKGYWATATADLATLTGDELHVAAAQFQSKTKISNPVIHTLINNMRIISSFNPESYGEKIRLRNLIFGKIGRLGIPLIWFTLNPHDIGNIFVVKLAGEDVVLDDTGVRSRLLKLTLKNPSLVAQYFHTIITAFFDCFFKCVSKEAGIFGTISSYFGVVESTTRMMLHLHGFAWLSGNFGAANLSQRLLSDSQFRDRLITYIHSIVKETVDLTLGQRFAATELPGSATFNMPDSMTREEFKDALSIDSNNVAAKVQMHIHSHTCTKYQRKDMKARLETQQRDDQQRRLASSIQPTPPVQQPKSQRGPHQICRFLFPKPLVPESIVTTEGFIRMQRNHQFVNKYNPVISSAIRCNHDVNFTPSSPKVLAAIYYMTNYITKSQTDHGQLVLAAAVLKKAQEVAEAEAAADIGLPVPKSLDMAKFALKAYHRFTRDTEVGAPAVAHFLLNQPSFYMPQGGRSVTINFYWVKVAFQTTLTALLNKSSPDFALIEAEQYTEFDSETRRPTLYENYRKRGQRLAGLCFYEYSSQIFIQTFAAAAGRTMCFLFEDTHPQHMTHVQVSVGSKESLATPSLCGSFTRFRDTDNSVLSSTAGSQDEIDETLLGLFYPWNNLTLDFQLGHLQDLRAREHKNTYIWEIVNKSLPPYLLHLSQNILLLRRSKEAADKDRKERGIEFKDYLETSDHNTYNDEEEINIDLDFATLLPTQHHLLQAALDVRGDVNHGTSRLRVLLNRLNTGTHFCDSAMVKTWAKELHPASEPEAETYNNTHSLSPTDQSDSLIPVLDLLRLSIASIPTLRAMFHATPTTNSIVALIKSQYQLNTKQSLVTRALFDRILHPLPINTSKDQFLLYLGGVGGVGKTFLITAFLFGLSIIEKHQGVLLTASTGAAAANIGGSTYHSALALYRTQPLRPATKLRLAHKKIFILDEVSMVSLKALVQLDERCNAIWDVNREGSTVFGGLPIVILLGDFNQFTPIAGRAIWSQDIAHNQVHQAGKDIWNRFEKVVFLTEQMRQAEDLLFQSMLERARSAMMTEEDVATLNSLTVAARVARGEEPPDRAVIRVNQLREDVNLTQLEIFAKKNKEKIYLFPARHDTPNIATVDHALLIRMMFRVGEAGSLKGPGFFAFTKGMPVMLLHNTKTSSGLVNGMTGTAERAILDTDVQGTL
jgi:PIF1-like helicase/helitron helicase-like protein